MNFQHLFCGVALIFAVSCGNQANYETPPKVMRPVTAKTAGFEKNLVKKVNAERAKHGLKPLKHKRDLARISRKHSRFLVLNKDKVGDDRNKLAHYNFSLRVREARALGYGATGEVVLTGWGRQSESHSAATIRGWMNSKQHRKAILSKSFNSIGIGCAFDEDGGFYATGLLAGEGYSVIDTVRTF